VSDRGGLNDEMFTFPWQIHPEAQALDALLAGACEPTEAPARLRPVADALEALRLPPDRRELAGFGTVLTAYRQLRDTADAPPELSWMRRPSRRRSVTQVAAAAGLAVAAVLSGGIAAAYAGSLPATLQNIAHDAIAAPAARSSQVTATRAGSSHPVGPVATGSAAHGLCNAYQHAEEHGTAAERSVAFRNLARAAGGASRVAAFCSGVQHPGSASSAGAGHGKGQAGSTGQAARHRKAPHVPATPSPGGNGNGNSNSNGHGNGHGGS
jgi:hypothetical protein